MNVFLQFKHTSSWVSANSLEKTLIENGVAALGESSVTLSLEWMDYKSEAFWSSLKEMRPTHLIIFDNRFDLRLWLPLFYEKLGDVAITYHIFGNPFERFLSFFEVSQALLGKKLRFTGGSHAQTNLLRNLLNDAEGITYLPFLPSIERSSEDDLGELKKKLGIEGKRVFLYAGRISYQKNVHRLLALFSEYASRHPDAVFIICGSPDNISTRRNPPGYYLNYSGEIFFKSLRKATENGAQIIYAGEKSRAELQSYYAIADQFLSLSTFEGEDFGLGIAEALSHGLSVTATKWGGHRDYESHPGVFLEEISFEKGALSLDLESFLEAMKRQTPREFVAKSFLQWCEERHALFHQAIKAEVKPFGGIRQEIVAWAKNKNTYELEIWNEEIFSPYWK